MFCPGDDEPISVGRRAGRPHRAAPGQPLHLERRGGAGRLFRVVEGLASARVGRPDPGEDGSGRPVV